MADQTVLAANNFLIPNATFIAELVAFLLVLGIIARFILPPLRKVLSDRQEMLRKQLQDTDEARQKLVDSEKRYQEALFEARTEAAQIREDARAEAQRTLDDMRSKAQQESARIVERGESQLAAQHTAIMRDLRSEIGTLAVELAEKITGQRDLGADTEVSATVDSFLAGLDADDHARSAAQS